MDQWQVNADRPLREPPLGAKVVLVTPFDLADGRGGDSRWCGRYPRLSANVIEKRTQNGRFVRSAGPQSLARALNKRRYVGLIQVLDGDVLTPGPSGEGLGDRSFAA